MTKDRVIGKNNSLPWHIPEEFQHFKDTTKNSVVIMGRKTYVSIPDKFRPLPGRHNLIISKSFVSEENINIHSSIEEAIVKAKNYNRPFFIIGGTSIYTQALEKGLVDRMYISYIKKDYDGDAHFPNFNKEYWEIEKTEDYEKYKLVIYRRLR